MCFILTLVLKEQGELPFILCGHHNPNYIIYTLHKGSSEELSTMYYNGQHEHNLNL